MGGRPTRATALPLLAILLLSLACRAKATGEDSAPIDPAGDPVQSDLSDPVATAFRKAGFDWTLTPKAAYDIQGVVLGVERYRYGWTADLSPCDVAMAWGPLAQDGLYRRLHWSQDNRWYWWEYDATWDRTDAWVARHSSNNHVIPATENLGRAARSLRKGELAELRGELVFVEGQKGEQHVSWHSSLTREDEGDGSCELIYLRWLKVRGLVYE